MKPERDANGIVRSWLENGVTQLPDRVLDDVLLEIPAIPQRRRSWGGATLPQLNRAAQVGLATAAVLLVVAMGLAVFSPAAGSGARSGGRLRHRPLRRWRSLRMRRAWRRGRTSSVTPSRCASLFKCLRDGRRAHLVRWKPGYPESATAAASPS